MAAGAGAAAPGVPIHGSLWIAWALAALAVYHPAGEQRHEIETDHLEPDQGRRCAVDVRVVGKKMSVDDTCHNRSRKGGFEPEPDACQHDGEKKQLPMKDETCYLNIFGWF